MAKGKIRGITVEIGGDTTKLGKALENVNKRTRDLQSELKEVEKQLKMDPGNADLIAQKQEILTEAIAETTEKLEILRKAQQQVEDQFNRGEIGADQYRAFQRELIETENRLESLQNELNDTENEIEDVGEAAEDSSDGFTVMRGALADLVSSAIQGAISAIGDLVGALLELDEATEEYRTMQAKLEGSAKTFGYSADFAKQKYEEFYKYLGDDQASTNAITNLLGLGTSTENVSALAEAAVAVWTAYGDSIPIEGLTEAINETAQVGKVTGSLADALNWAGISEDAFNEKLEKMTSTQERADYIAQTLNGTYGESKSTFDELNKSVTDANEAELELKETQAKLGEAVAPVNNALTDMKNQALEAILPLVEALADAFLDLYNWLSENPAAMTIVTALVIALATAFTVLAGALAIQALINGVSKAIAFLNTTLLANPIVLIIAAITALVAAFIYLWNNCDAFREFWVDLWAGIKKAFSATVEWFEEVADRIAEAFVAAWVVIKENWSKTKKFFSDIWSNIKNTFSGVKSYFANVFSNAWTAIKEVFSGWGSFWDGLWTKIKNKFSDIGSNIATAISTSVKSGINGVIRSVESIINKGIGLINSAISLANKLPGVNVGKLKTLSLPRLAKGAIVDSPTIAQIGEDGREAVLPLENNTGWLREIARNLNDYMVNQPTAGNEAVLTALNRIYQRLDQLQIVLDTGELVGGIIDPIDSALNDKSYKVARGW